MKFPVYGRSNSNTSADPSAASCSDGSFYARTIAGLQHRSVDPDRTTRDLYPGVAAWRERVRDFFIVQARGVEACVLLDGDRTVATIGRGHQSQIVVEFSDVDTLLLITRRYALRVRQDPDLQEMNRLVLGVIELAVTDAGPGTHALYLAGKDHRAGAQAVLVLERAFEDIGDDFHVAVRMRRETFARRHTILVDDAQRGKAHVPRVVIIGEGKRMPGVEPAVIGVAAVLSLA